MATPRGVLGASAECADWRATRLMRRVFMRRGATPKPLPCQDELPVVGGRHSEALGHPSEVHRRGPIVVPSVPSKGQGFFAETVRLVSFDQQEGDFKLRPISAVESPEGGAGGVRVPVRHLVCERASEVSHANTKRGPGLADVVEAIHAQAADPIEAGSIRGLPGEPGVEQRPPRRPNHHGSSRICLPLSFTLRRGRASWASRCVSIARASMHAVYSPHLFLPTSGASLSPNGSNGVAPRVASSIVGEVSCFGWSPYYGCRDHERHSAPRGHPLQGRKR